MYSKYIIDLFVFLNNFMNEQCNLFYKILRRAWGCLQNNNVILVSISVFLYIQYSSHSSNRPFKLKKEKAIWYLVGNILGSYTGGEKDSPFFFYELAAPVILA
jgi:hypothetical protein